jgi:hypothetical protein
MSKGPSTVTLRSILLPLARLIVAHPQAFVMVFVTTIMIGLKFALSAVAVHAGLMAVALIGVAIFVFGLWVDRRFPPDGFSLEPQQEDPPASIAGPDSLRRISRQSDAAVLDAASGREISAPQTVPYRRLTRQ